MNYPKISIVTPNFNMGEYLEETIKSVIFQNYPNLEYFIIDAGSTDNSVDIIKKYEKHLTYWISEKDNGMYDAIQKGFARSTGDIMAWINSDDMYHRNSFYTVAEIFNSFNEVKWLVGANTAFDEKDRTVEVSRSRTFSRYDFLNYDYKWIQQESVFWRRDLWEEAGSALDLNLKFAGDFELWARFLKYTDLYVTDALIAGFRYRIRNQKSFDFKEKYIQEVEETIRRIKLNSTEKKILKRYQQILQIENFIKNLKFLRRDWIKQSYRRKFFLRSNKISFDRDQMKFRLR